MYVHISTSEMALRNCGKRLHRSSSLVFTVQIPHSRMIRTKNVDHSVCFFDQSIVLKCHAELSQKGCFDTTCRPQNTSKLMRFNIVSAHKSGQNLLIQNPAIRFDTIKHLLRSPLLNKRHPAPMSDGLFELFLDQFQRNRELISNGSNFTKRDTIKPLFYLTFYGMRELM